MWKNLLLTGIVIMQLSFGLVIWVFSHYILTRLNVFGPLLLGSVGVLLVGYVLVFHTDEVAKWQLTFSEPQARRFRRWQKYTDKQMQEDSILSPGLTRGGDFRVEF
jgi:hypothetical protein